MNNLNSIKMAGATDVGQKREDNQDTFSIDEKMGLCLVCDGMGGTREGKAVAESAAKGIPLLLKESVDSTGAIDLANAKKLIRDVVVKVNNDLLAWGTGEKSLEGSGATLVMTWFVNGNVLLAHLGDSRIYLLRDEKFEQMTKDHTLANMLLRMGRISKESAKTHPGRNRLTRYIGVRPTVPPDIQAVKLKEDDIFLLCSDGLWGVVPDDEISRIITEGLKQVTTERKMGEKDGTADCLQKACNQLIKVANDGGGPDNITAVIVKIGKPQMDKEFPEISEPLEMR
jgi:PPM family protein phosphatase